MAADEGMTAAQARLLRPGDVVEPLALWNRTERPRKHLKSRTLVIAVAHDEAFSQTGTMVKVRTAAGGEIELDAGWFKERKER